MKTARFASIVKTQGKPENYLAFADPSKDRGFQSAVKANRVMTVFQEAAGSKTDHGEIGFHPGHSRQFLIFPRSLKSYTDSKVIGIKYDLLNGSEEPEDAGKSPQEAASASSAKKKAAPRPQRKDSRKQGPVNATSPPEGKKPRKTKSRPKPAKASRSSEKAKILPFPPQAGQEPDRDNLKKAMRKAMALLEDGKAVAAFQLLKKTVEEG